MNTEPKLNETYWWPRMSLHHLGLDFRLRHLWQIRRPEIEVTRRRGFLAPINLNLNPRPQSTLAHGLNQPQPPQTHHQPQPTTQPTTAPSRPIKQPSNPLSPDLSRPIKTTETHQTNLHLQLDPPSLDPRPLDPQLTCSHQRPHQTHEGESLRKKDEREWEWESESDSLRRENWKY